MSHFVPIQQEALEKLHNIYELIKANKVLEAAAVFNKMSSFVDSKEHLALSQDYRHLIWDLHEFLILGNIAADKEVVINDFEKVFGR